MSTNSQPKASVEQPENQGSLLPGLTYGGIAQAYLELLKLQDVLLRLANDQAEITKTQLNVGSEVIVAAADAARSSIKEDANNLKMQAYTSGFTAGVTAGFVGYGFKQDSKINQEISSAHEKLTGLNEYQGAMRGEADGIIQEKGLEDTKLTASMNKLKNGDFSGKPNEDAILQMKEHYPEDFKNFKDVLRGQQKVQEDNIHSGYSRLGSNSSMRQLLSQTGQQIVNTIGQSAQAGNTTAKASDEYQKNTLQGALQTNIDPSKSSKQMSDKFDQSNQDLQLIQSLLSAARLSA